MGVATADADSRSTRAGLEADTSMIYWESQRRRERVIVCMLSPRRRSAYRRVIQGRSASQLGNQVAMVDELVWIGTKISYMSLRYDVDQKDNKRDEGECCWRQKWGLDVSIAPRQIRSGDHLSLSWLHKYIL